MSRLDNVPLLQRTALGGVENLELFALGICSGYSPLPEVSPPFEAKSLSWHGRLYVYVFGWDSLRRRRLLEVFRQDPETTLEPLMAFQYPSPFRELFQLDFDVLFSDEPWDELPPREATER